VVRHRDFGSPVDQDEPITFTLYGQTFRCATALQGRTLLDFIATSADDNGAASAKAVIEFFDVAIVAADRERFNAVTSSEDTVVPLDTLAKIMEWLIEQYAGRPTEPSSPSELGDMTTGPMPVAVPSSPVPVSAT
jgi:hypothetical protein